MRAVSVVEVTLFMLAVVSTHIEGKSKCHFACKHMIQYNTCYLILFRFSCIQSNNNYDM